MADERDYLSGGKQIFCRKKRQRSVFFFMGRPLDKTESIQLFCGLAIIAVVLAVLIFFKLMQVSEQKSCQIMSSNNFVVKYFWLKMILKKYFSDFDVYIQ